MKRRLGIFSSLPGVSSLMEKRREFSEERILGYSPERVYDVVADLNRLPTHSDPSCHPVTVVVYVPCSYKQFLPWCHESRYIREGTERSYGQLSIGFPPLLERYTAMVLHSRPTAIRVSGTCQSILMSRTATDFLGMYMYMYVPLGLRMLITMCMYVPLGLGARVEDAHNHVHVCPARVRG